MATKAGARVDKAKAGAAESGGGDGTIAGTIAGLDLGNVIDEVVDQHMATQRRGHYAEMKKNLANPQPEKSSPQTEDERIIQYMIEELDGDPSYLVTQMHYYMANFIRHTKPGARSAFWACHTIENGMDIDEVGGVKVKFPILKSAKAKENYYKSDVAKRKKVDPRDWETLSRYFSHDGRDFDLSTVDSTYKNLMRLCDILNLNDLEKQTLKLIYMIGTSGVFSSLTDDLCQENLKPASVVFARMMDRPNDAAKIFECLHFNSKLCSYGLLLPSSDYDNDDPTGKLRSKVFGLPTIDLELIGNLERPDLSDSDIVGLLLGKQRKSDLKLTDFDHLGEQLDHLKRLVDAAVKRGEKGINILLHGPAGSGKTELAAALAGELGLKLYAVGEELGAASSGGSSGTAKKRMAQLGRSQALLRESRDSILLFDEIGDLLIKGGDSKKAADTDSIVGVHRILEENPVVTIWTGNDPEKFHQAVRQRMTYSIFMGYPPTIVRQKIWQRRLQMDGCTLPDEEVMSLARRYAAPPRMISHSVKSVLKVMGSGMQSIEEALRSSSKLTNDQEDGILIDDPVPDGFNIDLLHAEENLSAVFDRLVRAGRERKPFTLLVRDKPGLASDDFLRFVAEQSGMNPAEYSVASLVEPHPMMTPEVKIRSAFAAAVDGRQFLILTGLENMVPNPSSKATAQWNEPLVHLMMKEALLHRLPVAFTASVAVKLPDHVDMIFSERVTMKPLDIQRGKEAYQRIVGQAMPEEMESALDGTSADDLLRLRQILSKSIDSGIDHARAATLLKTMRASRLAMGTGIGFNAH